MDQAAFVFKLVDPQGNLCSTVIGSLALGAVGIGAMAIGALVIGRLVIGRARIRRLEIDDLVVRRIHITEGMQMPGKSED